MAVGANSRRGLSLVTYNNNPVLNRPGFSGDSGGRVVRIVEVCELTGLSRTTIWRRINDGSFPPSIPLGPQGTRARGWRYSDVQAWIDALPTAA